MGFSPEDEALKRILGDMDGMESKRSFGGGDGSKGVSITISVVPGGEEGEDDLAKGGELPSPDQVNDLPADHDIAMCGGGCAMHKGGIADKELDSDMNLHRGGLIVPQDGGPVKGGSQGNQYEANEEEKGLPPFLRKKKIPKTNIE